ncbi:MAG: NfeD family protein [Longimicrobiales bacterium]
MLSRDARRRARRIRWEVGAILLSIGLAAAARPLGSQSPVVYRIPVHGVIELGLAPFIERGVAEAEAAGAHALVLELETPGGRLDAAQQVVNTLTEAEIPVYAYVHQRAYSAGALIALAADGIFLHPGSVIGAATPVTGQGEKAPEKIVSAMRSEMRALAEQRGLDPRVAEAMVDEDVAIPDVVEQGKLLTLTATEAAALGYGSVVSGWDEVLERIGAPAAETVSLDPNWAESLVRFLTNPMVAPLLLSLGFLGLLIELKTPTFGLAGLAGGVSLALFFGAHSLVGLAGWEEIIVLLAGVALLGVEIFIVPGFGVFGLLGIAGILAAVYLSLIGSFATMADYSTAAGILAATVVLVLVTAWALIRTLPRNRRFMASGVLLGTRTDRETGFISANVRSDLVGTEGVALTNLRPSGTARFGDERVDVVAEGGWIESGAAVRIVASEGYRHVVRAIESRDEEGT